MKILHIITKSEFGGAQSVLVNLANRLSERHEVIVAGGEGSGQMWPMFRPCIRQERCKHLKRSVSVWHDTLALLEFRRLYAKYHPDIIHLHSSKAGMLGRLAFPSHKIVYTVHGFDSIRLAYRRFLMLEQLMQKSCHAIIGVSRYDEYMMRKERINNHVSYIYNGIERPVVEPGLSFNIPSKYKKTVLCVARMKPPKNSDLFMAVAKLLPEYAFVWIGNETEITDAPENTFFLGSRANAGMYNSIADLFMLPSNYEGLPIVIIEAMSLGKPVVASDVGGIREIVTNGKNGFVVKNSAGNFADKIRYILENESISRRFSANALKRYAKDLTVEKMVDSYVKVYAEIKKE